MNEFRVAIVGCGGISKVHREILMGFDKCVITACCDIIKERADETAEFCSCKAYTDFETMLKNESIDVIHICTPHYLHTPMTAEAAKRGIAVFTEKPPAMNREQWNDFEDACKKTPVGICFQNRYNPAVYYVKNIIASSIYGKLESVRAFVTWFRDKDYYTKSGWRDSLERAGGGALINQSIHTLDLMVQFAGRPVSCDASMSNHHLKNIIEVEDTLEAYIKFENDVTGIFFATTAYNRNSPVLIELSFEQCTVRIEDNLVTLIHNDNSMELINLGKNDASYVPAEKSYWGNSHKNAIVDFYESLNKDNLSSSVPISCTSIADTMNLMLDIYDSARKHD